MPGSENPIAKRTPFDYDRCRDILQCSFEKAEGLFHAKEAPPIDEHLREQANILFASNTQSYREALIGCSLVRIIDPIMNIRLPYVNQGPHAFNGRTLDEGVVNPALQSRQMPCSKGPYLASIRRSVTFVPETRRGLRDKAMYDAFLEFIAALENGGAAEAHAILHYILYRFLMLREASTINLAKVRRLSMEQLTKLLRGMLNTPSGGLIPVLMAVAILKAVITVFQNEWEVDWQGINVADRATGVGGDITITRHGHLLSAIEVTERVIDRNRVVSTFNTKIAPRGLAHYIFFFSINPPTLDAQEASRTYFAQGHDIVFMPINDWIGNWLMTFGPDSRDEFLNTFLNLLDNKDVPAAVKIAWNKQVETVIA